jgi:hypothetical protein
VNDESRPKAAHETPAKASTQSVPDATDTVTADIPTLDELSPRGREIASAYMESGMSAGIEIGRQGLEREWHGRQEISGAIARLVATSGPWDALADLRGDHVRAERQRAILAERGIA